jgi:hypothetical protein
MLSLIRRSCLVYHLAPNGLCSGRRAYTTLLDLEALLTTPVYMVPAYVCCTCVSFVCFADQSLASGAENHVLMTYATPSSSESLCAYACLQRAQNTLGFRAQAFVVLQWPDWPCLHHSVVHDSLAVGWRTSRILASPSTSNVNSVIMVVLSPIRLDSVGPFMARYDAPISRDGLSCTCSRTSQTTRCESPRHPSLAPPPLRKRPGSTVRLSRPRLIKCTPTPHLI